jgi:thioredoxin 1
VSVLPPASEILELDDATFGAAALRPGMRVVVDFWAPSCAPCITIGRRLAERAPELAGKLLIVKVNADEAPETAATYGVRGLPTLILIKDGVHTDTSIGALAPARLDALLARWLTS